MSDNHLVITPGAKLASSSPEFVTDSRNGNSTNYTYEGTREECVAQRLVSVASGANHTSLRPRGDGFWQLTVGFPFDTEQEQADEPAGDIHELEVEAAQPHIFANLKIRTLLGGGSLTVPANFKLSDDVIAAIQKEANRFQPGETALTTALANLNTAVLAISGATATISERAQLIFKGVVGRGVDSFPEYRPVYRRTITAATPLQTRVTFKGAGKIWTTAELRNFEQLPREWWFKLPTEYQWLKSMPSVRTVAGQKTQITYNYIGALTWWAAVHDKYRSAVLLDAANFPTI